MVGFPLSAAALHLLPPRRPRRQVRFRGGIGVRTTVNGTLASRRRYDVIVVGAGIAGSLVAKRLGHQGWRVLVLEAGTGGRETWEGYLDAVETFRSAV